MQQISREICKHQISVVIIIIMKLQRALESLNCFRKHFIKLSDDTVN